MAKQRRKHSSCLNCNNRYPEANNFCPNCGQENHDRKVKFRQLISDFLADYFTFDSKMIRSITPLLFKPGKLTNEFNQGHRVKFIPPLRLYIFMSIIYFALLSAVFEVDRQEAQNNPDSTTSKFSISESDTLNTDFIRQPDQLQRIEEVGIDQYLTELTIENDTERFLMHQMIKSVQEPGSFQRDIMRNASIMMFFFLPIAALQLLLFYRRKRMYYVEHVVFLLHFHSFAFMLGSLLYGISLLFYPVYNPLVYFGILLIYLFAAMQYVYKNRWWVTAIKWLFYTILYALLLSIFILLMMVVSFLLF